MPASSAISTENQRRQWSRAGRFEHHRISSGEGGRDFPGGHQQGKIPRNDLRADPIRFSHGVVEQGTIHGNLVTPDLPGQISVVFKAVCGCEHIPACFDNDLAGVHRFEPADLVDALTEDVGNLVKRA